MHLGEVIIHHQIVSYALDDLKDRKIENKFISPQQNNLGTNFES